MPIEYEKLSTIICACCGIKLKGVWLCAKCGTEKDSEIKCPGDHS